MTTLAAHPPAPRAARRSSLRQQISRTLLLRLPLAAFLIFTLFPIYWMARSSIMSEVDLITVPLRYLPWPITFGNYVAAFQQMNMTRMLANSLIVAGGACILSLALVLISAYAMSRFDFWGTRLVLLLLLGTQMLPGMLMLVPLFVVLKTIGLLDTLSGIILAELLGTVPFSAVLLKQFFDQITPELDDAAMIDGCTRLQLLFRIVTPLVLPGMVAATIYNFIGVWNSLLLPAILLLDPDKYTLPIALMLLRDRNAAGGIWGMSAAGGMLNLIPSLILFAIIQRYLISGLSSGAVKG